MLATCLGFHVFGDSSTPRDISCCHVYRNLAGDETNSVENTCVRVVGQKKHCRDTIAIYQNTIKQAMYSWCS